LLTQGQQSAKEGPLTEISTFQSLSAATHNSWTFHPPLHVRSQTSAMMVSGSTAAKMMSGSIPIHFHLTNFCEAQAIMSLEMASSKVESPKFTSSTHIRHTQLLSNQGDPVMQKSPYLVSLLSLLHSTHSRQ
jgi:hypothetical protein